MNILLVSTTDLLGTTGDAVRYQELSRALADMKHEVFFVGVKCTTSSSTDLSGNVHVYPINMGFANRLRKSDLTGVLWQMLWVLLFNLKCFATAIKIVKSKKVDVCLSYSTLAVPVIYFITRLFRLPWIYDVRGLSEVEMRELKIVKGPFLPPLIFLERSACRSADRVLVVSERMKRALVTIRSLDPSKVSVSEDGVDLSLFNPQLPKGLVRSKYSIPAENPLILFVGALSPREGIDRLIKAMKHVVGKYPEAKLIVVGGGAMVVDVSSQLKKLTTDLGLEKNVVFVGRVKHQEVPFFIIDSDICVAPFTGGFSPIKVYEYLACGKPTIVTGGTDIGDLLIQKNAGLAVDTAKPGELASVILDLVEVNKRAQTLSKNGFNLAKRYFTWRRIAEKLTNVISELRTSPKPDIQQLRT